jgi:hypothetical protein
MKVVLRLCSYYSFRHNVQLQKVSRNIDDLDVYKIVIVYVTTYSDLAYFILLMLDREKSIGNVASSVAASAVIITCSKSWTKTFWNEPFGIFENFGSCSFHNP